MREMVMVAVLAAFIAAPALAQKQEASGSAAAKGQAPEQTAKVASAGAKKGSRRHEDARHCLERKGNVEIIKCAEQYL